MRNTRTDRLFCQTNHTKKQTKSYQFLKTYTPTFVEIESSNWPPGPYAIPTPIDGCPESYPEGWTEGYINITTRVPFGITITQNLFKYPLNNNPTITTINVAEDRLHIPYTLGPYGRYTFQFNFCYKSKSHTKSIMLTWPPGDYSIYGNEDACPTGKILSEYILKFFF